MDIHIPGLLIFNGFDERYMNDCPFPVIPEYLAAQNFPEDAIQGAKVTHVWDSGKRNFRTYFQIIKNSAPIRVARRDGKRS